MALSREDVRFGVVPGIARLGEVLANAFSRQQEMTMNLELEKLRLGAKRAETEAKARGTASAKVETEAKGLRGQLSTAVKASDKALAPKEEENEFGVKVPDYSAGREEVLKAAPELKTSVVDAQGKAVPDPTLTPEAATSLSGITERLAPSFTRHKQLSQEVEAQPRTPITQNLMRGFDALMNSGVFDVQSGRAQRVMRSLEVLNTLESTPGLLERVQNLDMTGGSANAGPEVKQLFATLESLPVALEHVPHLPQLIQTDIAVMQQNALREQLNKMPAEGAINSLLKNAPPVGNYEGALATRDPGHKQGEGKGEIQEQLSNWGWDASGGPIGAEASETLARVAAEQGDEEAAALIARLDAAPAKDQAEAAFAYAAHIEEVPDARNPITFAQSKKETPQEKATEEARVVLVALRAAQAQVAAEMPKTHGAQQRARQGSTVLHSEAEVARTLPGVRARWSAMAREQHLTPNEVTAAALLHTVIRLPERKILDILRAKDDQLISLLEDMHAQDRVYTQALLGAAGARRQGSGVLSQEARTKLDEKQEGRRLQNIRDPFFIKRMSTHIRGRAE